MSTASDGKVPVLELLGGYFTPPWAFFPGLLKSGIVIPVVVCSALAQRT